MTYRERFKQMMISSGIGFGIGLVLSIIIVAATKMADSVGMFIAISLIFALLLGSIIAMIICARKDSQGVLSGAVTKIWGGIKGLFFSNLFGSPLMMVIGIIRVFIGLLVMLPIGIYMAVNYFLNLIYTGIMAIVEKKGKLEEKAELCEKLDKIVSIVSLVIVVVLSVLVYKNIM